MIAESRYSPVSQQDDGAVRVELAADHPGVTDPAYRARRDELAALALAWSPGQVLPRPAYRPEEHEVWRIVSAELAGLHQQHAVSVYLEGKAALALPGDGVPQLDEVSSGLGRLVGFTYRPVAGLAPLRDFYGAFADGVFCSTQYLRHPSVPLYTPEPDVIHEVIGHANQLAHPNLAAIYRQVGEAVRRTTGAAPLRWLSQVFWFSMEFGLVREGGELKALGAGILSSVGETRAFVDADVRRPDLAEMGRLDYDITRYQPVLYAWDSLAHLEDQLGELLTDFDDEVFARRVAAASPA
ncbi:MAG: phenylalanine 4-monooxygenase [Acidimicrobiales bacterium]